MKTSFKKAIAFSSIIALVAMNSTFASSITFTWSVTGGDTNTDVEYDTVTKIWTWLATVNVSATVLPTLSMVLSSSTIDFWDLVPWTPNTKNISVTTASNAIDWITVSVASTWLATWDTATDRHIWALQRVDSTATTWTDSYEIQSSTNNWWTALTLANVAATQVILTADNVAKSNAVTTVDLTATTDAQTEAWNYNDTLTFTVTWNF